MDPISLLIIAGSSLLGAKANHDALKRQEQFRGAMEAYQRSRAAENQAAEEQLVARQTPNARGQELADLTGSREQSLRDTVGAAQSLNPAPIAGKLSSDYKAAQEAEANTVAARTKRAIEQLAVMGAPGEQQQKFALRYGKAAGDVDAGNRAMANVGEGYMTDIGNVRPNQMLTLLSQAGMGAGIGMASRGGAPASGADVVGYGGAGDVASAPSRFGGTNYTTPVRARVNRGFSLWGNG